MCTFFAVSRSGYYAFVHRLDRPEKDAALAEVIAQQRERSFRTYGYRRMWLWLRSQNIFRDPKTVLRVMKKYDLLSEIRRRRKWQQMGQQVHRYKNLLNREFHANQPNSKWVTDISYIHTKQGVLYLSMIRDLYDNSIVAYKTGTQQTVNLVLDTIRLAMEQLKGSGVKISIATKSDLILRDLDLIKTFPDARVSWSVNTLDENFKNYMDSAVSIQRRLAAQ